jgi:type II secretory pathway pseudopilin PulG
MRLGGVVMQLLGRRVGDDDSGLTLVELGVGMAITALLSTLMVTWLSAGVGSETSHRSYDDALADLRHVTDQMSKEIRSAGHLTAAGTSSLGYWLDGDRDGVVDTGETVTWAIDGLGITRSTDADSGGVLATSVSEAYSSFSYDSDDPAAITRVTISLVTLAENRAGEARLEHTVDIHLRNR